MKPFNYNSILLIIKKHWPLHHFYSLFIQFDLLSSS